MATGKMKSTNVLVSGDVKAAGGPAIIRKIQVAFLAPSAAGIVEIRDATSPPGDTGTLRWSMVIATVAAAGPVGDADFAAHEASGLYMPNGIRVTLVGVTNATVWVLWEG